MRVMLVDVKKPLPVGFFSPLRAVSLVVGLTLLGGLLTYGWLAHRLTSNPMEAPACYWADQANYVPPRVESIPLRGALERDGTSIDRRHDQPYLDRLAEAEKVCKVTGCSRQAWEQYRSALFWVLSSRLQHTRQLDRGYGQLGLRRAAEIYSEPIDAQVEKGLRDRYRAEIFRFNDFRQNKDAIAILVLKGGAALRPCRKADVAAK